METVTHNVRDLPPAERSAIEHLLGHALREGEQVVIQVLDVNSPGIAPASSLPEWCNVYKGLSEEEVANVERAIRRADLSRTFE